MMCLLVVYTLLLWGAAAALQEEQLIGWMGEKPINPEDFWDPLNLTNPDKYPLPASRSWVEHISWKPRAFVYHNFITPIEAKHFIELAAPQMRRSTVVGEGGRSVEDDYRTSYGTFLRRYQDEVVARVENRVAAWTHIPVEHQEDTQILRYGIGQFYKVHADTLRDDEAGPRVATILIYLNEPDEGGETAFPRSEWINPELEKKFGPFSDCAKGHVAFRPKRGDALMFWSINPDGGSEDFHASHTGCAVISGVKWTATKWVHAKPFRPNEMKRARQTKGMPSTELDPGNCVNINTNCDMWAKNGDCEKNYEWMVQGAMNLGYCRKSCNACTPCDKGNKECFNSNRRNAGYLIFNPDELQPL